MKYFLVENHEANYRNWYTAESLEDARFAARHDSQLLSVDVIECDRESIPSNATIYPATKRDVAYILNTSVREAPRNIDEVANFILGMLKAKQAQPKIELGGIDDEI